jgi:hypothetical protein
MKDKLSDEAFELASTDSERDAFRTAIAEASDWLYAGGAKVRYIACLRVLLTRLMSTGDDKGVR